MTTPDQLHAAVLARLQTISSLTIYDGDVDEKPEADDDGRVFPYAVLWVDPGWVPASARTLCHGTGDLTWDARVTLAAGNTTWLLRAIPLIRGALDGWRPVPGAVLSELDGNVNAQKDRDVTPPRWFVPFTFRTSV